jgi:apolipoprotein N-acyltransferase
LNRLASHLAGLPISRIAAAWWFPLVAGCAYALCLPPFNGDTHPLLSLFPLLSFVALVPMFHCALVQPLRRAVLRTYLYGIAAAAVQLYWISNVNMEGLWPIIMAGLVFACFFVGAYFLAAGMLFRLVHRLFPRWWVVIFPAVWVLIEVSRSVGELAFPWMLLGYTLTPLLPLAQAASVCGVLGLSFVVVLGNTIVWWTVRPGISAGRLVPIVSFCAVLVGISVWGFARMHGSPKPDKQDTTGSARVAMLQINMDQAHWGSRSLDTAFSVTESLAHTSMQEHPDLIVLPESALLCYLVRRPALKARVQRLEDSVKTPIIVGALHWELPPKGSYYEYLPYNTAFCVEPGSTAFRMYHKMRLLPFSEALPFESKIPLLSRVNLGESDFHAGKTPVVFDIGPRLHAAPFICYEMIFPGLVRERMRMGANLLVNITNDGWFGRSSAAYAHATMARMRCIENGVSMVRCANSGISMAVDQFGRILGRTPLYARTALVRTVSLGVNRTWYTWFGDWPAWVSLAIVVASALGLGVRAVRSRRAASRGSVVG